MNGEQVCSIWSYHSHSLMLFTGSSTWHLMAKNSLEDLKKRIVALHKDGIFAKIVLKIAKTLKLSCSMVAKPYSGLTGQLALRTGLATVDQS